MMKTNIDLAKLFHCFPRSFINENFELIVDTKANDYISLGNCESDFDVKCKVLEQLSRSCFKTQPYRKQYLNDRYHEKISGCVNDYLGTDFNEEDFALIYQKLGNGINHELTARFVSNNYDTEMLKNE